MPQTLTRMSSSEVCEWARQPLQPANPACPGPWYPEADIYNAPDNEWKRLLGWSVDFSSFGTLGTFNAFDRVLNRGYGLFYALYDRASGDETVSKNPGKTLFQNAQKSARYWAVRLLDEGWNMTELLHEIEFLLDHMGFLDHITFPVLQDEDPESLICDMLTGHALSPKEVWCLAIRENLRYMRFVLRRRDFSKPKQRCWMDVEDLRRGGFQVWRYGKDQLLYRVRDFHNLSPSGHELKRGSGYFTCSDLLDLTLGLKGVDVHDRNVALCVSKLTPERKQELAISTRETWVGHMLCRGFHGKSLRADHPILNAEVDALSIGDDEFAEMFLVIYGE